MSHTYVAYKREDEVRVARLVEALRLKGLDIWFDAALAGGVDWRRQLAEKLQPARCVLVVWSRLSVDLERGNWVQEEAQHGLSNKILVPVKIDNVNSPLGFGSVQAIDLTHWRGDLNDPIFLDVVAAIEAKLAGKEAPPARGRANRLWRRVVYTGLSTAGAAGLWAMIFNTFGAAEKVCTFEGLQPALSDTCGSLHIGNRPSHEERLAWEAIKPGDCKALAAHARRFPFGAYAQVATNLTLTPKITVIDAWVRATQKLPAFEGADGPAAPNMEAAHKLAVQRALPRIRHQCEGFTTSARAHLIDATAAPVTWSCHPSGDGMVCGFEGDAVCTLDLHQPREETYCGG